MAKFEKGNKMAKGRPKGVPNKSTAELKDIISKIVGNHLERVEEDLLKIRKQDPAKALELGNKLIDYVLPKQTKIDLEGEIKHKVEKVTIEIKKGTIDGTND